MHAAFLELAYTPEQLVTVTKGARVLQHYLRNAIAVKKLINMSMSLSSSNSNGDGIIFFFSFIF
jgi:hypothetical protein